jgi:hypothetical protein
MELENRGFYEVQNSLSEQKLEKLRRLKELQDELSKLSTGASSYYDDPVGFARDCVHWGERQLAPYQADVMTLLQKDRRVAVRAPRGTGKSTTAALTVLWFAVTRDASMVDWKVVTTAGSWSQLCNYLWPEIKKWAGKLKWDLVRDGKPFSQLELQNLSLRLRYGSAFAAASSNPHLIEGAHADSLLVLFDESKAIPAETFDAIEGAFTGTGEVFTLAVSTPGAPQGRFYDMHSDRVKFRDWTAKHITLDETLAIGQISQSWVEQRRIQWGEQSALYQNHVLGEFYAGEEDSIIPLSWVEAAVERWQEWDANGRPDPGKPHTVGVDVARSGTDKTVLALRQGNVLTELRAFSVADTMVTTGRVKAVLDADENCTAIVDVIGIGAGVLDRLREQNCKVQAFNAAARSNKRDKTNEIGFLNTRAAAWWSLRELLDPSAGSDICLPPNDDMLGDLTALKMGELMSGGKMKLESKDSLRKRIGRSTDHGDAVVQAFWSQHGNWHEAYGTAHCNACGRGFLIVADGVRRTSCPFCRSALSDEFDAVEEELSDAAAGS